MLSTLESPHLDPKPSDRLEAAVYVELVNGQTIDISQLDSSSLLQLQCEQEPAFARKIAQSSKDSAMRVQTTKTAYETVCAILQQLQENDSDARFTMGMDPRYKRLVFDLLKKQTNRGIDGGFFEIGFSSGALLSEIAGAGYTIGGLEVADQLLEQAKTALAPKHHAQLLLGDFRSVDLSLHRGKYSVVYWNDVFEHIVTDEISEYLETIHSLLQPGGVLVTITPNWHMRPSDITDHFMPPRSEAIGFHMKEYTLREVRQLLRQSGFSAVRVPAYISKTRIHDLPAFSMTTTKALFEPALEWLTYTWAVQYCRRLGLNCTIAAK